MSRLYLNVYLVNSIHTTMATRDELEMKYITENTDEVSNKYKTFQNTLLSFSGVSCWENPDIKCLKK